MTTWNLTGMQKHVLICNGSSCQKKVGEEITVSIRSEIKNLNLDEKIHTTRTRCNGRCNDGCVVIVYPEGTWYSANSIEVGRAIIQSQVNPSINLHESLIYQFKDNKLFPANGLNRMEGLTQRREQEVEEAKE